MNKKDWQECLKRLEELLKTAKKNSLIAKDNVEEMEFLINCHQEKIKTFK